MKRMVLALVALCGSAGLVRAADTAPAAEAGPASNLNVPVLPTFALNTSPASPSPWTGLYVGTEVFAVSGGKGVRGGFGGGGFAGYDREFDNGVVLGVEGSVGYAPALWKNSSVTGYQYGQTNVRVGYDMGQFMPFVTAGLGLARANSRDIGGYSGVSNAADALFNSNGNLRGYETVGAGFAYRFNDHLSMEVSVQHIQGRGPGFPAFP